MTMTAPDASIQSPNESQLTLQFDKFASFVQQFSGNLALGGAFVETPKVRPVGTEVQLTCELPDGFSLLRGLGDVVWTRPRDNGPGRPAGMGIRFNALDQNSRELVLKIVEENLKDGGEPFEIEQIPADATDSALPTPQDVTLDEISEDPTVVGSLVQPPVSAASTVAASAAAGTTTTAGPGFAAPWGEKLPEIPVDILEADSDPEIEEAVRSIRPDPSIAPAGPAADPASGVIAIDPDAMHGAAAPESPVVESSAAEPAAPRPPSPAEPLAPEPAVPAAPEFELDVPAAPTFDLVAASEPSASTPAFDDIEAPPSIEAPLVDDETYIPATPAVEAAGMAVEIEPAPTFETPAEPAPTFETPAEPAPTFEPSQELVATFEPSFDSEVDLDADPPTVVFAADEEPGDEEPVDEEPVDETPVPESAAEVQLDVEPAPSIESLPSEPDGASFAAIDEAPSSEVSFGTTVEPTAEVVFEPPADDLDAFALDDDVEGVDFGGTFSSAPELDEVDFGSAAAPSGEPASIASTSEPLGAAAVAPVVESAPIVDSVPAESVTMEMPFDPVAPAAEATTESMPEASFTPPVTEPVAGFEDRFDGDFDEPAAVAEPAAATFEPVAPAESFTAEPVADFGSDLVTPAAAAVSAFESSGIEASAPAATSFETAASSFDGSAADTPSFEAPAHDVGDTVGAIHADDFVDPWDGDPATAVESGFEAAHVASAASAGGAARRLPVKPLIAAVVVLAAIGAGYVFRDDLMGLVGLGSPEPVVQQARGPRPGGGQHPPGRPAGGPPEGSARQAETPGRVDGEPAAPQSAPGDAPSRVDAAAGDGGEPLVASTDAGLGSAPDDVSAAQDLEPVAVDEPPIEPAAAAPPPPVAPPAPTTPRRSAVASGGIATILSIDSRSSGEGTQIVVRFDRPIESSHFEFDPLAWAADREMLKLFQVENYPLNEIRVSTAEVARVRLGFHGVDELRLVFDRSGGAAGSVQLGGDTLTLSFPRR